MEAVICFASWAEVFGCVLVMFNKESLSVRRAFVARLATLVIP